MNELVSIGKENVNGEMQNVVSSKQVASKFNKRHADVMRAVLAIHDDDFNERNFASVKYTDKKGEERPMLLMNRDGFSMLVMGFTGREATQ